MGNLDTLQSFSEKYGKKANENNTVDSLTQKSLNNKYIKDDENRKNIRFPSNSFPVGKNNDGSVKYSFDTIYDDQQLIKIAEDYFNQRGDRWWDKDEPHSDRDIVDKFISDRTWKQANTLHMMGELNYVLDKETDIAQKQRLAYLMDYWNRLPNFYAEGGRGWLAGLSSNIGRGMADPINYVGGIFAGQFVKQGVKQAGKDLLKRSAQKSIVKSSTLKATGIMGAADAVLFGGADALIQQTEKEIEMRDKYDPTRTAVNMILGAGITVVPSGVSSFFLSKSLVSRQAHKVSIQTGKPIIADVEREIIKGTGVKSLDKAIDKSFHHTRKKKSLFDKEETDWGIMNKAEWAIQKTFDRGNVFKVLQERLTGIVPQTASMRAQLKKLNVKDRDPMLNPYQMFRMMIGSGSEAEATLARGVNRHTGVNANKFDYTPTGNRGLFQILNDFDKKFGKGQSRNLMHYVMALRTLSIYDYAATLPVGKRKAMTQNLPFGTQAEAKKMVDWAELSHSQFAKRYKGEDNLNKSRIDFIEGAKDVKRYFDDLGLRAIDDGLIDQKQWKLISKRHPFFLPMYTEGQVQNNLDLFTQGMVSSISGVGAAVKKRIKPIATVTGGKLQGPIESAVDYTYSNMIAGRKNLFKHTLYREIEKGEKAGILKKGEVAEEITGAKLKRVRAVITEHAIKQLEDIGVKVNKSTIDDDLAKSFTVMAFADNVMEKAKAMGLKVGQKVDIFYDKGKMRAFIIKDEGILDTYKSFDNFTNPWINKLTRFTQPFARLPAQAITYSPPFAIWNIQRDSQSSVINSAFGFKLGWSTFKGLMKSNQGINNPKSVKSHNDIFKASDLLNKAMVSGMGYSTRSKTEKQIIFKAFDKLETSPSTAFYKNALNWIWQQWGGAKPVVKAWAEFIGRLEYASRLGEFELAKKAGASDLLAGFAGREVATDFGMRGSSRILNLYSRNTMFFNAGLQGFYRGSRRLRETESGKKAPILYVNPKATAAIIGVSVLPELALWALNNERREYEEIADEVKIASHLIPMFVDEQPDGSHKWPNGQRRVEHYFPVAKPFDFGVFGNITVAVAEGFQHNSPTIGMQYFWKSMNQILPGAGFYRGGQSGTNAFGVSIPFIEEPGFIRPWADLAHNFDWAGSRITPYGYEELEPVLRIKSNTRESAIRFAQFMDWLTTPQGRDTSILDTSLTKRMAVGAGIGATAGYTVGKVLGKPGAVIGTVAGAIAGAASKKLINPIEMDYIMNSYFTGLFSYPWDMVDARVWQEDRYGERKLRRSDEQDIDQSPWSIVTRRFNLALPVKNSQNIRKLYEIQKEAERVTGGDYTLEGSWRHILDTLKLKENYTNEEANQWRAVSALLADSLLEFKNINEQIESFRFAKGLSGAEKTEQRELLIRARNHIAYAYLIMLSRANFDKAFSNLTGEKWALPTEPSEVGGLRTGMEKTYEAIETGFEKLFGKK